MGGEADRAVDAGQLADDRVPAERGPRQLDPDVEGALLAGGQSPISGASTIPVGSGPRPAARVRGGSVTGAFPVLRTVNVTVRWPARRATPRTARRR